MKHLSSDELLERPVALNDVRIGSNNLSCVHKLLVGEWGVCWMKEPTVGDSRFRTPGLTERA